MSDFVTLHCDRCNKDTTHRWSGADCKHLCVACESGAGIKAPRLSYSYKDVANFVDGCHWLKDDVRDAMRKILAHYKELTK